MNIHTKKLQVLNKEAELRSNIDKSNRYWKQKLAMQIFWLWKKEGFTFQADIKLSWNKVRSFADAKEYKTFNEIEHKPNFNPYNTSSDNRYFGSVYCGD